MTPESAAVLERLLQGCDLGWMIDLFAPKDRAIPFLLQQLEGVTDEYRGRTQTHVSFTPETLAAEAERNPHRIRAFLQAMAATRSREMLVMVWRILQGLNIHQVDMNYREEEAFNLVVVLAPSGEKQNGLETYRSQDVKDAALVRHFGITTVNGKPLFDGFYPFPKK